MRYKEKYNNDQLVRKGHNSESQTSLTTLWKQFWTPENHGAKYFTRINPEFKIFWREARESRVKKYRKNSSNYDTNKKNGFLTPQYTVATTMTINAGEKNIDFNWNNSKELKSMIEKFNQNYNHANDGE